MTAGLSEEYERVIRHNATGYGGGHEVNLLLAALDAARSAATALEAALKAERAGAAELRALRDAAIWMSGADVFGSDDEVAATFRRKVLPLLTAMPAASGAGAALLARVEKLEALERAVRAGGHTGDRPCATCAALASLDAAPAKDGA